MLVFAVNLPNEDVQGEDEAEEDDAAEEEEEEDEEDLPFEEGLVSTGENANLANFKGQIDGHSAKPSYCKKTQRKTFLLQ